jgi:deoxyhypusine synthase
MNEEQDSHFLFKKVAPFNVYKIKTIENLLDSLKGCGFQGRNLGKSVDILYEMVTNKKILTVLTVSGAMVPAGMGDLICALIENRLVDVIISTGANTIHDLVDVVSDIGHYIGSHNVDDNELFKARINRIYDVFLPEDNYKKAEIALLEIIHKIFDSKKISITPSELMKKIGEHIKKRCILSVAAKHDIPIFVPAFSDSELALNLIKFSQREGYTFNFDILADVLRFADIIRNSEEFGTLILGGGTPRNWAQQIFPLLDQIDNIETMGYNYSVRITSAIEYDGGLSGCTISESKSWGKYSLDSKYITVWCDATIAFPILITGLFQKLMII